MVAWYSGVDFPVGSLAYVRLVPPLGGAPASVLSDSGVALATPGTVDANAVTRLQYNVTDATFMVSRVTLIFDAGDVAANPGKTLTASSFHAPASAFAAGYVPTPAEIRAAATIIMRGTSGVTTAGQTMIVVATAPSRAWAPNEKWWTLVAPTAVTSMASTPSIANDVPIGDINVNGRAVSMWTNRTPLAPAILSPVGSSITVFAGDEIKFSFDPRDPDEIASFPGDLRPYAFDDLAGVQLQRRPAPTSENPDPPWEDMPITNTLGTATQRGWFIRWSATQPANDGAEQFWTNRSIQIRCGASDLVANRAVLPSGNWQVRMRTFDWGHPWPWEGSGTPIKPLNQADGLYTPDTYPAANTSPWTTPITLYIGQQVPPPIPLYPTNGLAVVEGQLTEFTWQYRNNYVVPFAQAARTVQVKRTTDVSWSTVVSGPSADHFVPVQAGVASAEYAVDPGFEGGTTGGWEADWVGGVSTANVNSGTVHSGTRALSTTPSVVGTPGFKRVWDILPGHEFFSLSLWMYPGSGSVVDSVAFLEWLDALGNVIDSESVTVPDGLAWHQAVFADIPVPPGATQVQARTSYVNFTGSVTTPARIDDVSLIGRAAPSDILVYPFEAGVQYMWRVQTTDTDGEVSSYSDPAYFWVVPAPGSGEVRPLPSETIEGATLGCGKHRVEIFRRGGTRRVGELTQLASVEWNRARDEISDARIVVAGWDVDCGNLLSQLQTWAYEVVITRDNGFSQDRVWEGPITLLTYERDRVIIDAKDIMAYARRRIIKQAMSDVADGAPVTNRAMRVLLNAFAPDDPNVIPYLSIIANSNDAMQYRSLPAYSRTAYEEIDDMAANAGLDYTVAGRSILVWGTKNRIGLLPEFTDDDLGSTPIVSEYGMSMANRYAVSDGNGVWGEATRLDVSGNDETYGLVEMLSSTWATETQNEEGTYTQAGLETVRESFAESAERSIASRYPPPVVVRVPDNTTLNPDAVISIQHLIPGVAIPLRSTGTLRAVRATQKLDAVKVVEESGTEKISITMSPFAAQDDDTEVPT